MSHHSHHSPNSSSANGPPSSPFGGTNPTVYSPEFDRKPHHRRQITAIALGKQVSKTFLPQPPIYVEGAFANELDDSAGAYVSRYQQVHGGADIDHLKFLVQSQMKRYECFQRAIPFIKNDTSTTIFVRYDRFADAAEGKDILSQAGFAVDYVSMYDYARAQDKDLSKIKEFEGQIYLPISIKANPEHAVWEFTSDDFANITKNVELIAKEFGPVRHIVHTDTMDNTMQLGFRVEFDSIDAAHRAVQSLRLESLFGYGSDNSYIWSTVGKEVGGWAGESLLSPPRYLPRIDAHGRYFPGYNTSPTRRPYFDRQSSHPHDQHNRVRRERILDGSDVRTTVMLRNIPAALDWMALKNMIDIACFGTYDFLYLRIDFKKGQNVGYAFINFTDANGMLMLLDKIEHKLWPGFSNCGKRAEVSYATIQGHEALVQKFRNSSVMQETPFCRPHLFFTLDDAEMMNSIRLAGTESPFPRPDNISKLQRSMDSARSTGLYPPRGFSSGTEYRNRSSAYDRGSPRDMMQAAVHLAHHHAAPVQFTGLTEAQKQDIEAWYLNVFGGGQCGPIGFNSIPMTHIRQYFHEYSGIVTAPGVIGGPVGSFSGTPPRRTRGSDSLNWRPASVHPASYSSPQAYSRNNEYRRY